MVRWDELPELVLAKISSYCDLLDRVCISKTCRAWEIASYRPEVWTNICISGQKLLLQISCNMMCLDEMISDKQINSDLLNFTRRGSPLTRRLSINLCREFDAEILAIFATSCKNLEHLDISIWPSDSREKLDYTVYDSFRNILYGKNNLHTIRIYEVPLINCFRSVENTHTGEYFRNTTIPFNVSHAQQLKVLWIINSFKSHSLSSLMYLVNLKELAINPQQLNYSLLKHLASKSLRDLYLVANENCREFYNEAMNNTQWEDIRKHGPQLRVHCYFSCNHEWTEKDVILKSKMPLKSLVYRKNVLLRYPGDIFNCLIDHNDTLEEFVDYSMSELTYQQGHDETFENRLDHGIIKLVTNCRQIKLLTVKEPLSIASLAIVAHANPNIKKLLIRSDMILHKNDVPDDVFPNDITKNDASLLCERPELLEAKMSEWLCSPWKSLSRSDYFRFINEKYKNFR